MPAYREAHPQLTRAPARMRELSWRTWWHTLKRTVSSFRDKNATDWAAALTYYGVLAVFPALIALVSIIGLVGASATDSLLENLTELAPGPAREILTNAINTIADNRGTAGLAFVVGVGGALWSASGYVGAFGRASNALYEVEEGRPFWKLKPAQLVLTAVLIVLLALCGLAVVATGPIAEEIGKVLGMEGAVLDVWDVAKWPVIALVVSGIIAVLYWGAPNVRHKGFAWITPGGLLAVALWLVASALFALYAANFSSYNATYGALAGVVVFLVWLWISNNALLLGAAFNAELERGRELEGGVPPQRTIALEPREERDDGEGRRGRAEGRRHEPQGRREGRAPER
jgi:membrane protein